LAHIQFFANVPIEMKVSFASFISEHFLLDDVWLFQLPLLQFFPEVFACQQQKYSSRFFVRANNHF